MQVWNQQSNAKLNPTSAFGGQAPATPQQTAPLLARLAVNYPRMNQQYAGVSFWTMLGEQLVELGWSEERIRYAVNKMIREYEFPTFTAADFLKIDLDIPTFTGVEAERLPKDIKLAIAKFGDKWKICYLEDAKRLGLEYNEWKRY